MNAMYPMQQEPPETEILREKIRTFAEASLRAMAQLLIDCGGGRGPDTKVFKAQEAPETPPAAAEDPETPPAAAPTTDERRFKEEHFQPNSRRGDRKDFTVDEFYKALREALELPRGGSVPTRKLQGAMRKACAIHGWAPVTDRATRWACYQNRCVKHECKTGNGKIVKYVILPPYKA